MDGDCSSEIGTDATGISKGNTEDKATMFLHLGYENRHIEHLVMHEFGHALGLGHEHQRDVLVDIIKKFLDEDKMKKYFGQHQYDEDVSTKNSPGKSSEYDVNSIMHYW